MKTRTTRSSAIALFAAASFFFAPMALCQAPHSANNGATASPHLLPAPNSDFLGALKSLSPEEQIYFQHNATLSNPFFEGRAPGSRGNELAAEYCEFYFKKTGLLPLFPGAAESGDDAAAAAPASFRQPFRAGSQFGVSKQSVSIVAAGAPASQLEAAKDFTVLAQSGTGSVEGHVVFVGYSIERGPDGYNSYADKDEKDFEGADLTGKIALILRFEPKDDAGKSRWVEAATGGTRAWSGNSNLVPKLRRAVQRGAAGIILVNPPGADDPRTETLDDPRSSPRGRSMDIPIVQMSIPQAAQLCAAAGKDLIELTRAADQQGGITPLGEEGGPTVRIEVETKQEPVMTSNVAGLLPGKGDLADQYVIIGGHYDHLGYGAFGSRDSSGTGKLHPGADDNASGTAGVLLAAEIISRRYKALPADASVRSIIFMAFSAEEGGLIGSNFFVKNSPVTASATYAMLNMDMIGRLRDDRGLEVSGTGTAEGFADLLKPIFDNFAGRVRLVPGGSGPSDHASFYRGGVPVLAFFTGLHREYHMPTDVYTTVNTPGAVKVVNLLSDVAVMLAARAEPLVFVRATGPSVSKEGMSTDSEATPSASASGPMKVRFGIAPASYADDEPPGVGVGDVYEGTSAAEAGIKIGDRLIRWNGQEIKDVEGWMIHLRASNPGDIVHVVVKRGEEELTIPVTMKGRDTGEK